MPNITGELVEHRFKKTTIVGNSYVFFAGTVKLPKHVLNIHLMEKEAAKKRKQKSEEVMGLSAAEIAALETSAEAGGTEGESAGGEGDGDGTDSGEGEGTGDEE